MGEEKKEKDVNAKEDTAKKEARLVVSHEAEAAVSELTDAVNEGFEAGRATRFDVASFMILWYKTHAQEDVILEIRRRLADELSMLDAIYKKAKSSGEMPDSLRSALEQYFFGSAAQISRKNKKSLKHEFIEDKQLEQGDAA